jgi:structural maintenance of chromosome 2
LNGSGKSNILDSICFVLGISNLSQVRAGNLSELVYKQGQAGVNKATVTIVFNNEDPNACPVGYESVDCPQVTVTRQVLIGGKSKYLINGRTAQAAQVQNLFHSVSLNVNNPHFLIMQGRITKVLNMKPHEILGMVEEAAGTRMYECKRVAALKTIDKKQLKLDELNVVLSEDITPTLERLRGEKQSYLQWSKNNADIGRLERFVVAAEFLNALQVVDADKAGSAALQQQVEELETQAATHKEALAEKEEEIRERASQLRGDLDDRLAEAKEREQTVCRQVVKVTSAWRNSQETVIKAESDLQSARSLWDETNEAVVEKQRAMSGDVANSIDTRRTEAKAAEELVAQLSADYQAMSAGIATSTGEEGCATLPEQISKAHSDSKKAEARAAQAKMKIEHLSKQVKVCVLSCGCWIGRPFL